MQADKDAPLLGGLLAVTASTVDDDENVAADDDGKGERGAEEEDWWRVVVAMIGVSASLSSKSLRRRVLACPGWCRHVSVYERADRSTYISWRNQLSFAPSSVRTTQPHTHTDTRTPTSQYLSDSCTLTHKHTPKRRGRAAAFRLHQ